MSEQNHLSRATFDRLKAEYDDLSTRGRIDIADKIETARQHGDLKENAEYHAAKEEKAKMEARIAQISRMIDEAVIVEEVDTTRSVVTTGCVVSIRYQGDDEVEHYLIGSIEERHEEYDVISPASPLGEALIGTEVGHSTTYQAPGGTLSVEVVEIRW